MNLESTSLIQLTDQVIRMLIKEIGVTNTLRFINQFSRGSGDYTQERELILKDLTLDEIISRIKTE